MHVGRGARDAVQRRRGAGDRAVGGLRHGDALVAGALHDLDEPARVPGQEQAVGVEREDVGSVEKLAAGLVLTRGDKLQAVRTGDGDPARPHQRDIGVEVHRLVRRVREVGKALALKAGDLHVKERPQTAKAGVELLQALGHSGLEGLGRPPVRIGGRAQDALHEERVGVVVHRMPAGLPVEPAGDLAICARRPLRLGPNERALLGPLFRMGPQGGREFRPPALEGQTRGRGAGGRLGEQSRELVGQRADCRERRAILACRRIGRIVDEQDHGLVGMVLQRG